MVCKEKVVIKLCWCKEARSSQFPKVNIFVKITLRCTGRAGGGAAARTLLLHWGRWLHMLEQHIQDLRLRIRLELRGGWLMMLIFMGY
ncbi:unnamed protein product [Colias eurytheme]|nr:unnamed protein product [Colias eurytheme]